MSTRTGVTDLPPKLLDQIFRKFHDEKHTLSNVCLVCKAWMRSARPVLFSEVTVSCGADEVQGDDEDPTPDWMAVARAFRAMPDVVAFVKTLHISGEQLPPSKDWLDSIEFDPNAEVKGRPGSGTVWTHCAPVDLASLLAIAQLFPNLNWLSVQMLVIIPSPLPKDYEPVRFNFLQLDDSGTIQGENPFIVLRVFRPAKLDLDMFYRPGPKTDEPALFKLEPVMTTREWRIRGDPNSAPMIRGLAASSEGRVAYLSLDIQGRADLEALQESLDKFGPGDFGPGLKKLALDFWDSTSTDFRPEIILSPQVEDYWREVFSLETCHGLEAFEVTMKLGITESSCSHLQEIIRVLSTAPTTLRSVRFLFDFMYYEEEDVGEMQWKNIATALPLTKYDKLEKVQFTFIDDDDDLDEDQRNFMKDVIVSQLPELAYQLQFEFITFDTGPMAWETGPEFAPA
ncbi:hypothetical protein PsYK624_019150 [Phanerochaete sordida]|uniref:F-box domain-containing protein n=1 Tax=Phanerochaete sordida TaxID=48140 RepID=A0A9P3G077_9APHY|nr:hypothetical protein PsYK624_019150 [Phanerochaete sordida]